MSGVGRMLLDLAATPPHPLLMTRVSMFPTEKPLKPYVAKCQLVQYWLPPRVNMM